MGFLATFDASMPTFAQSSQFSVICADVTHLLRFAPFAVRTLGNTAVLHYYTPNGIWQGAPIIYVLAKGMHVVRWQALVLNPTGRGFFVRSSTSPWGEFSASHLFEGLESGTLIRDELQCKDTACQDLFAQMHIAYEFNQRSEMEQLQSSAPTRELPQLGADFSVG